MVCCPGTRRQRALGGIRRFFPGLDFGTINQDHFMEYVHILALHHWESKLGRFSSQAFKPSTNGGISVIELECIRATGEPICGHLRQFYPHVAGEPPIFWIFPAEFLPNSVHFEQTLSDRGDPCHRNIQGISEKQARKLFKDFAKSHKLTRFLICQNGDHRELRLSDLP